MKYFIMEDDLVAAEATHGEAYEGSLKPAEMRYIDGLFVDVRAFTEFYIDDFGRKHAMSKPEWQKLSCNLGDDLIQENGLWIVKPEALKLEELKKEALEEVLIIANQYHNQISQASPEKLARYEAKAKMAQAYQSGKLSKEDTQLLQAEADIRELSLKEHVTAILTANKIFVSAAAIIEAIEAKGKRAIQSAQTSEELKEIQENMPDLAEKIFQEWKENLKTTAENPTRSLWNFLPKKEGNQ